MLDHDASLSATQHVMTHMPRTRIARAIVATTLPSGTHWRTRTWRLSASHSAELGGPEIWRHTVIDNVSMTVRAGEAATIIGPTGAGKRTLGVASTSQLR